MTEAAIAAFVIVALALLGVAMEMEYQPTAPSYAAVSSSASAVTWSVRYDGPVSCTMTTSYYVEVDEEEPKPLAGLTENREIIGQNDPRVQAVHRLETEG